MVDEATTIIITKKYNIKLYFKIAYRYQQCTHTNSEDFPQLTFSNHLAMTKAEIILNVTNL